MFKMNDDSNLASTSGRAECYLIVYNVAKKHNIGTLARSATAFNVTKVCAVKSYILRVEGELAFPDCYGLQICLVGSRHYNTFGGHGSAAHMELAYFPTLQDCCSWLKQAKGKAACMLAHYSVSSECMCIAECEIIGVEITESALAVNQQPFSGNTAFMLGNEVRQATL